MGYFSNGSEGMDYEAKYCARCIHGDGSGAGTCAVMAAHFLHNYEECNKPESILHMLIPRNKDGFNGLCLPGPPCPTAKRSAQREAVND